MNGLSYKSRIFIRLVPGCLIVLFLSACTFGVPMGGQKADKTGSGSLKKSKYGNPSSYIVMGKRYYVMDSAEGFTQKGVASWYGPNFHGKRTSSGETYDMHAMTAAHKTLPIPVYVKVKNVTNGKTAIVLVNDRGPFAHDRIIDLSFAAAKKLDVVGPGTAKVEIVALNSSRKVSRSTVKATPLKTSAQEQANMYIQLGSFSSEDNARKLSRELTVKKETAVVIKPVKTGKGNFFRVQIGPLLDLSEANSIQNRLKRKGYKNARIVIEDGP